LPTLPPNQAFFNGIKRLAGGPTGRVRDDHHPGAECISLPKGPSGGKTGLELPVADAGEIDMQAVDLARVEAYAQIDIGGGR